MILKPLKLRKYSHMKDNVVVWLEYVDKWFTHTRDFSRELVN